MMDRLDEIALLIAILDAGTLAGAARATGRSPAAVTRILAEMEARLGVRLVERTTRQLAATEAGLRLAENGRRLLADFDETIHEAMGDAAEPKGRLRVTAPLMFGRLHVAPIVVRYLQAYPQVDVELVLGNAMSDLVAEHIDVAVRIGALDDSRLTARQVGQSRRVVVASPDYLARHGKPATPDELQRHTLIMMSVGGETQAWRFEGAAARARARLTINQSESAIDAAVAGAGLVRVFSYQVADELKAGVLVRVLKRFEPPPLPVSLVYTSRKHMPLRTRAFLDLATSILPRLKCIR